MFTGKVILLNKVGTRECTYVARVKVSSFKHKWFVYCCDSCHKEYTVHHRDGNRLNNLPANLELRASNHGVGSTTYTQEINRLLAMIPPVQELKAWKLSDYVGLHRKAV